VDIHSVIAPNTLLVKAGLYDPQRPESWKALFHCSGGGATLQLRDKNDKQTKEKVLQLLRSLPATEQRAFIIKTKEEVEAIGGDPNAAFGITGNQGFSISPAATGNFMRPGQGGTHGFFPDFKEIQTGFVAFGKGIRKGAVIPKMGLVDIAPLISRLLQLDMPAGDGMVYEGMLKK
jgi:hypothetical protein